MLADLAMRDGQPVAAFDLFGDLDLRRGGARVVALPGGSLTALVDAAVQVPARGVVYGASFENHPALVARLARAPRAAGQHAADAARGARPAAAGVGAARRGPRVPAHVRRRARRPLGAAGCASRCAAAAARACGRGAAARCPAGTVVQERIDGVACSAAAVGDGVDAVVLGLTEQLVGRRAFGVRGHRWCGNVVPPRLPAGERDALLGAGAGHLLVPGGRVRVARAVRRRLRVGRRARVDDRGQPAPHGVARGDRGRATAWASSARTCGRAPASCRRSRARAPARPARRCSSRPRTWSSATAPAGCERGVRDVPHPGERIAAGHPICTVVAAAATPDEACSTRSRSRPRGCARSSSRAWRWRRGG